MLLMRETKIMRGKKKGRKPECHLIDGLSLPTLNSGGQRGRRPPISDLDLEDIVVSSPTGGSSRAKIDATERESLENGHGRLPVVVLGCNI
jgi:hypothetical protein